MSQSQPHGSPKLRKAARAHVRLLDRLTLADQGSEAWNEARRHRNALHDEFGRRAVEAAIQVIRRKQQET